MSTGVYQCMVCGGTGDDETPCGCPDEPLDWQALMPRCTTCTHWQAPNHPDDLFHRCLRLMAEDNLGDGFLHVSGGEYRIMTRNDFGCILHEPKETT